MPDTGEEALPAQVEQSRRTAIAAALARSLAITGRGLRLLIFSIAALAALAGVLAMVVGALSWRHADHWRLPLGVIIVIVLCLPAVTLPFLVHRRLVPITRAIEHPDALTRQALDYVGDVRSGTELADLAAIAAEGPAKFWRIGSLMSATRIIATFTSRVTPNSDRHPLLAAFMPVYLKTLWLALLVTAWSLVVAISVLVGSLIAVAAGWTPTG